MVMMNGQSQNFVGITLSEYLKTMDYDSRRIAIERNGGIVPRADYGKIILKDGDQIEIVSFVGGG